MTNQVLIDGQSVEVEITRKARLKRLNLRIDMENAKLKVSAPLLLSKREINYFISEKSNWIVKNLKKASKQKKQKPQLIDGDTVYLQGQNYKLRIVHSEKKRTKLELRATEIIVRIYDLTPPSEQKEKVTLALKKFYKNMAKHVIEARLEHFNKHYKLKYNSVSFKELKSRWGSCSSKKNLNFNWKLVLGPIQVLDYVVVHELCHLKHMNHSEKYWELVAETIPNHKKCRKWLRDHGHFLSI